MIVPELARCDEHVGEYAARPGCRACQAEQQEAEREAQIAAEAARAEFLRKTVAA
jgi:hypothetical protein